MAETEVRRGLPHPWLAHRGPDWDFLEIRCASEAELAATVAAAERKFWRALLVRVEDECFAVLHKPSGAAEPWGGTLSKAVAVVFA